MSERPSALVVGGGLAGLATACELVDQGLRVTLLESRPFLGGRAYSYTDKGTGETVDNGQHVFLGCCTEYIHFLQRLGIQDRVQLQKRLRIPVIDKVWGKSHISDSGLPAGMHLIPSLLRFRSLTMAEKTGIVSTFLTIRSLKRSEHPELDDITFGEWMRRRGQSRNATASFWDLIVRPALNDESSRVSADLALMVFQEALLKGRTGANIGWAKVGLSELLAAAARRYIERSGSEIRLGTAVQAVEMEGGSILRALTDDGDLSANLYFLAVPPSKLLPLLPTSLREDPFFARVRLIDSCPIVNVHLWYDMPVWEGGFAAFLNTPVQWAFNKTRLWGKSHRDKPGGNGTSNPSSECGGQGQYIDISLSGAQEFAEMPAGDVVELFRKEMEALFPGARAARLNRALVVKQREATFQPKPGISRLRPSQSTPIPNLFLAGDWTATGWPATMESAVRSGLLATRQALATSRLQKEVEAIA